MTSPLVTALVAVLSATATGTGEAVMDVGSRRQLFVDGALIESMQGVRQVLHRPVRRATSEDFRHWTPLEPIQTGDAPREEFSTNSTIRYERHGE